MALSGPNPLDAPIPGQSLTDIPGNHPWEKPPQYTKVDDAMNYVLNQFSDKDNVHNTLACLEMGIPITAVAKTFVQQGFANGKWTPDMSILLLHPLMTLLVYMAKQAHVKFVMDYPKDQSKDAIFQLAKLKASKAKTADVTPKQETAAVEAVKNAPTGLMAPRGN